jgi:hypothetical protein
MKKVEEYSYKQASDCGGKTPNPLGRSHESNLHRNGRKPADIGANSSQTYPLLVGHGAGLASLPAVSKSHSDIPEILYIGYPLSLRLEECAQMKRQYVLDWWLGGFK